MPSLLASLEQFWMDFVAGSLSMDASSSSFNNTQNTTPTPPTTTTFGIMAVSTLLSLFLYWKERQRAKLVHHELACLRIKVEMAEHEKQRQQREYALEQQMAQLRALSERGSTDKTNNSNNSNKNNNSDTSLVLHIVAPDMMDIPVHEILDEWRMFQGPSLDKDKKNYVTIHVHFVLIQLVNTWIRQGRVARSNIHVMPVPSSEESTHLQIIVKEQSNSATRSLVNDLERCGFDSRIGMVYATPILSNILHVSPSPNTAAINASTLPRNKNTTTARQEQASSSSTESFLMAQPHVVRRVSDYLQRVSIEYPHHDDDSNNMMMDNHDDADSLQRRLSSLSQWTVGKIPEQQDGPSPGAW